MRGIIDIERAVFVVSVPFPHMKRRHLLKVAFPKPTYQLWFAVCKDAITTQEKKTFVNFEWFLANYTIIYVIIKKLNNFPGIIEVFFTFSFNRISM